MGEGIIDEIVEYPLDERIGEELEISAFLLHLHGTKRYLQGSPPDEITDAEPCRGRMFTPDMVFFGKSQLVLD